jgi:uncharacterized membrane protein
VKTGWPWLWRVHRGKILGALAGMVLTLLIMWLGWWTIPFIALAALGAAGGGWLLDRHHDIDLMDE